jgi:hypothetical protein
MNICYRPELSEAERGELQAMLSRGKRAVRQLLEPALISGQPRPDAARKCSGKRKGARGERGTAQASVPDPCATPLKPLP